MLLQNCSLCEHFEFQKFEFQKFEFQTLQSLLGVLVALKAKVSPKQKWVESESKFSETQWAFEK